MSKREPWLYELPIERGRFERSAEGLTRKQHEAYAKLLIEEREVMGPLDYYGGITDSPIGQRETAAKLGISIRTMREVLRLRFAMRVDYMWRSLIVAPIPKDKSNGTA
jgi:hypothetical protein